MSTLVQFLVRGRTIYTWNMYLNTTRHMPNRHYLYAVLTQNVCQYNTKFYSNLTDDVRQVDTKHMPARHAEMNISQTGFAFQVTRPASSLLYIMLPIGLSNRNFQTSILRLQSNVHHFLVKYVLH